MNVASVPVPHTAESLRRASRSSNDDVTMVTTRNGTASPNGGSDAERVTSSPSSSSTTTTRNQSLGLVSSDDDEELPQQEEEARSDSTSTTTTVTSSNVADEEEEPAVLIPAPFAPPAVSALSSASVPPEKGAGVGDEWYKYQQRLLLSGKRDEQGHFTHPAAPRSRYAMVNKDDGDVRVFSFSIRSLSRKEFIPDSSAVQFYEKTYVDIASGRIPLVKAQGGSLFSNGKTKPFRPLKNMQQFQVVLLNKYNILHGKPLQTWWLNSSEWRMVQQVPQRPSMASPGSWADQHHDSVVQQLARTLHEQLTVDPESADHLNAAMDLLNSAAAAAGGSSVAAPFRVGRSTQAPRVSVGGSAAATAVPVSMGGSAAAAHRARADRSSALVSGFVPNEPVIIRSKGKYNDHTGTFVRQTSTYRVEIKLDAGQKQTGSASVDPVVVQKQSAAVE